mmetsp:Transcript_21212/g.29186  ORF Transcript_21212/g.29186 Transcript_21212/m.29186 type:complete len:307 (+) Transcript_21212:17-937(+)
MLSRKDLFHVGVSIFLISLSMVIYLLVKIINAEFTQAVTIVFSCVCGILVGISTLTLEFESMEAFGSYYGSNSLFLMSLSLTFVLAMDAHFTDGRFQYVQLPNRTITNDEEDQSLYEEESDTKNDDIKLKRGLLFSHMVALIVCWQDLILSCQVFSGVHYSFTGFIRLLLQKIAFSILIPTVLEDNRASEYIFWFYLFLLSISTFIGMLLPIIFAKFNFSSSRFVIWNHKWISGISAGVLIYIVTIYILPRNLLEKKQDKEAAVSDSSGASSFICIALKRWEKLFKFVGLLIGYAIVVIPAIWMRE